MYSRYSIKHRVEHTVTYDCERYLRLRAAAGSVGCRRRAVHCSNRFDLYLTQPLLILPKFLTCLYRFTNAQSKTEARLHYNGFCSISHVLLNRMKFPKYSIMK